MFSPCTLYKHFCKFLITKTETKCPGDGFGKSPTILDKNIVDNAQFRRTKAFVQAHKPLSFDRKMKRCENPKLFQEPTRLLMQGDLKDPMSKVHMINL